MPNGLGENHDRKPIVKLQQLTVEESNAILKEKHVLVHPGNPICRDHKKFVVDLLPVSSAQSPKKPRTDYDLDFSDVSDNECSSDQIYLPYDHRVGSTKRAFMNFAAGVGISRVCSAGPWNPLKITKNERRASAARKLIDSMLSLMVPDKPDEFRKLVEKKFVEVDSWTSGSSADFEAILTQIAEKYVSSEDRNNRILISSLVANTVSYPKVEEYIPGLSAYMYDKAKKFARRARTTDVSKGAVMEKYNRAAVEEFIQFITSPTVMIGLPYGVRKVKLPDNSKAEIPNSIRQQSATEIIEMYTKICEDNNRPDLLLGTSTMYKILNVCAASKREATTCVDYFIAMGMESFDGLHEILDGWKDISLFDTESMKRMKTELFQAAQYLRTDYRMHVKNFSRVADHCATFALSDPSDVNQATSCSNEAHSHTHDLRCDRCQKTEEILNKIETHVKEFIAEESAGSSDSTALLKHKEEKDQIARFKKNIFEMKKHLLRAAVTNIERQNITADLKDNEALVTMDFAQKFLPKWHREKQSDYFGKKGISYHISHVTARIGEVYAQHSFVHIYEGSVTQDNKLVVLTLSHFLAELKKVGIVKVHLRSDNAGAYHSVGTIGSLHWLIQTTGMAIGSYTFSEAQNGKSSSDRDANRVKKRVKEFINKGNDVTTSLQFFNALKENPPNGISVYHGGVTTTDTGSTEWKGISTLNYFTVENNGIRAKRYAGIGKGIFVEKSTFKPITGTTQFADEAGFLASKINSDLMRNAEREAVQKGLKTSFWYHPKCSSTSKCVKEPDVVTVEIQDYVPSTVFGDLYYCPEPGCSSTFLKFDNLEKHMLRGQHSISPERITEIDYALNLFSRTLETINAYTCPSVEAALTKMREPIADTKIHAGWALPEKKTRRVFGKNVVAFLIDCFNQGVKNKKPMNPIVVSEKMRTSKKFQPDELLDARQIAGFFSREADKRRHSMTSNVSMPSNTTQRTRRHYWRPSPHRRRRISRTTSEASGRTNEEYIETGEEHPDSGLISFLKLEEFWNFFDELYDTVLANTGTLFLPN